MVTSVFQPNRVLHVIPPLLVHLGSYELTVPTWKARGSIRAQLRTFFIGGSPELADITYTSIPTVEGPVINKYGFATEGSGSLLVRMNVVILRYCNLESRTKIIVEVKRRLY